MCFFGFGGHGLDIVTLNVQIVVFRGRRRSNEGFENHRAGRNQHKFAEGEHDPMETDGQNNRPSYSSPESPVPLTLSALAVNGPTEEESDIPGFAYDTATGRYYRIQNEASGPVGFENFCFSVFLYFLSLPRIEIFVKSQRKLFFLV